MAAERVAVLQEKKKQEALLHLRLVWFLIWTFTVIFLYNVHSSTTVYKFVRRGTVKAVQAQFLTVQMCRKSLKEDAGTCDRDITGAVYQNLNVSKPCWQIWVLQHTGVQECDGLDAEFPKQALIHGFRWNTEWYLAPTDRMTSQTPESSFYTNWRLCKTSDIQDWRWLTC